MGVFSSKIIPFFTGKSLFRKGGHNELVQAANALLNMRISRGVSDEVIYSDVSVVIQLDKNLSGSGGGGAKKQYKLVSVAADYCTVKTWDGTNLGATAVYCAKPYCLRYSAWATMTIQPVSGFDPGHTVTYTYLAISGTGVNQQRTAIVDGDSTYSQAECVMPNYKVNDIIYADAVDHTGVNDLSGNEIKLIDTNSTERRWVRIYSGQ